MDLTISKKDRVEIADILSRRANEIAGFANDYRGKAEHYGSVELALTREMERLRVLAHKVNPPPGEEEDED
jgi:hypothetical protein